MFKKISILFMAFALPVSFAYADEAKKVEDSATKENAVVVKEALKTDNTDSIKERLNKLIKPNNPFFKNSELTKNDKILEDEMIKNVHEKYLDKKNYNVEELNTLFGDFIILGFNDAADLLFNTKEAQININRYNASGFTPLMLSAISNIEGGNVEYAKKLIEAGANPNQLTLKNNIPVISLAAHRDKYKVVALLVFSNANFLKVDDLGMAPIDHAFRTSSVRSAEIIKEAILLQTDQYVKNKETKKPS